MDWHGANRRQRRTVSLEQIHRRLSLLYSRRWITLHLIRRRARDSAIARGRPAWSDLGRLLPVRPCKDFDDRIQFYTSADGLPAGQINALYVDHAGRLWVGSGEGGVARLDSVLSVRPHFACYTVEQGLSSNRIVSITEDTHGRMYFGTGKGVDRLDVSSGRLRRYTEADGLPSAPAESAICDRTGVLWFGTQSGLARMVPETREESAPPSPLIQSVRIAGDAYPLSDLGVASIGGISLEANENNVEIQYASISQRPGDTILYQVRLGRNEEWSAPMSRRVIHYGRLAPGAYTFEARAINASGLTSARSATVQFAIAPPIWHQTWFLSLAALLVISIFYWAHRYRLWHAVKLERIRARLAMDLHDELGSGLAEMAISSELAKRAAGPSVGYLLDHIAERCRELRGLMADIVWAVDPRHDKVADLIGRIRQSAYALLETCDCRVEFLVSDQAAAASLMLEPDRKRHILLVVREALTNVVRHAAATEVRVEMHVELNSLHLRISDNGRGFDTSGRSDGRGLPNLGRRSLELKATIQIDSTVGQGTTIDLHVPLRRALTVRPA